MKKSVFIKKITSLVIASFMLSSMSSCKGAGQNVDISGMTDSVYSAESVLLETTTTDKVDTQYPENTETSEDKEYTIEEIIPDMDTEYIEFINYRDHLINTNKRLNEDKELSVLFYGGSLTAGYGASDAEKYSWRALTYSWFETSFPDVDFNFINRAIGESGTFLGTYRLKADVIDASPDLIFLEYAINDMYFGSDYKETLKRVETIVREINEALPETEIIMLITTDVSCLDTNKTGRLHLQGQSHEAIAKSYGIPSLHIGRALAKTCGYSSEEFNKYAVDIVHLNDDGYRIYYKCIEEFLTNALIKTDFSKVSENDKKTDIVSDELFDGDRKHIRLTAQIVSESESMGGAGVTFDDVLFSGNSTVNGVITIDSEDDVFVFKFIGTEAAVWCDLKNKDYMISVDGGDYVTKRSPNHTPAVIVEGVESEEHTVKIKMAEGGSPFKIGSIFTRDANKATKK